MSKRKVESKKGEAKKAKQVELPPEFDESEDDDSNPVMASTDARSEASPPSFGGAYVNKQRVLVFCSRGVTARSRHLLEDIRKLLPHHKKEVKLDSKDDLRNVNEIAEIKTCNSALFFEARKRQDLYLWGSKTPHGPSAKFLVSNIHTMDELRLTGNCMLGSRPVLNFCRAFETAPHLKLLREVFVDLFGTPRGHPKSKPFIDRVMTFHVADEKIWVRNYQILDAADGDKRAEAAAERSGSEATSLVEVGPRFVLTPIRIFAGSFGGATLYTNPKYVSPNAQRAELRKAKGSKYEARKAAVAFRKEKEEILAPVPDELADTFA